MPKISQIDEVTSQAEVRILQKITLNSLSLEIQNASQQVSPPFAVS